MGSTFRKGGDGQLIEHTPLGSAIVWQDAPVGEVGVTGDQPETLLAVIVARLDAINRGYDDPYTNQAIRCCEEARGFLRVRRERREAAKVEGTNEPTPA